MENNLSSIMGRKLLKISHVHKATGVSRSTLTDIYFRRSENMNVSTLIKICDFLNIRLSDLIEYDPTKKEGE